MSKQLQAISAVLKGRGVDHVLVLASSIGDAERFLDLALPNDYLLWGHLVPKALQKLDSSASDAAIRVTVENLAKKELARISKEHGVRTQPSKKDWDGFFRDRIGELREMFDSYFEEEK